jgi:hypothetical protein
MLRIGCCLSMHSDDSLAVYKEKMEVVLATWIHCCPTLHVVKSVGAPKILFETLNPRGRVGLSRTSM